MTEENLLKQIIASRGMHPFRLLVRGVIQEPRFSGRHFETRDVAWRVFSKLKSAAQQHPAVIHMNLHHEYALKHLGLKLEAMWNAFDWSQLEKLPGTSRKADPYSAVYQEIAQQVARELETLRQEKLVFKKARKFLVIKRPPAS